MEFPAVAETVQVVVPVVVSVETVEAVEAAAAVPLAEAAVQEAQVLPFHLM